MNLFRRGWAGAWAAVYFLTNTAAVYAVEKSLWEERRAALRRTASGARAAPVVFVPGASRLTVFDGGSTPSQPPSNFFKTAVAFDAASAALPFGSVSNMREGRRGAPVVFLVQDVHGNDGAQKNIGGLLTEWAARGVTAVGVEGAWVPIDSSAYHNPPSPSSVAHVAGALRSAGWLTGAEWAGLTSPHPISLTGIESPELYHANLKAARECVARRPAVAEFLTQITDFLQTQKKLFYSSDLTRFDRSATDYHDGHLGLGAHVRFLAGLPGAQSKAGVQVKRFLNALDWETRLSFAKADSERQGLMDRLSRCLDSRALDTLLNQAVAYRAGKMTNGDFYSYLKNLCAAHRISLKEYPAFSDYLRYLSVVQSIQRGDLLRELDRWETDLAQGLAKTPEERRLLALDADAVLLKKLLENEMSPESWATFLQRRDEVLALPARLGEWGDFKGPSEGLAGLSHPHQEFCRLAIERNKTLASNFLANVKARKADRAVLVSGGFHTPGLQDELARQGCSTVVITPRIDKVEGKPLDVFARDPLPFDHLFAGKPISLSPELLMGTPGGIAVLNMAITMDASGSAGAQKGLRTVRFNVAGKELFAAMGPKKSLDEISKNHPRLGPVLIKDQTHFVVYSHKKPKWTFGEWTIKINNGLNLNRTVFGNMLTWFLSPWMASRKWIMPPSDQVDPLSKKNMRLASTKTFLAEPYLRYNAMVRDIVHPNEGPYSILYGGSGVDISNALLISSFTRAFFISPTHGLSVSDLIRIKEEGVREDPLYAQEKFVNGFSDASRLNGKEKLLSSLSLELKGMSISLSSLEGFEWNGRPAVRFYWTAPGESVPTLREIIFVDADITQPAQYGDILLERFDLYLQRAGMLIPWSYRDRYSFIKVIENSMKPDGFFATDDFALNEPGEFIALVQSFPLKLPVLSIPEEQNLLDQVIRLRSEKSGKRVWANQTQNGYGFLLHIRPMSNPSGGIAKTFLTEEAERKPNYEKVNPLLSGDASFPLFDPRPVNNGLLAEPYARYAESVRRIVNPNGTPSTILYGGAGADISHALLMSNFKRAFFVSSYKAITLADLARVKQGVENGASEYRQEKREDGFSDGSRLYSHDDIVSALSVELQSMGVSLESIGFFMWKGRPGIRFLWQGAEGNAPLSREIVFVDADITEPEQYTDVLSEKFDLYLQRAGMRIPYAYRKTDGFIESISRSMNPGAFFVTDDSALEEAGILVDLGHYFPLKLRLVPIPREQELLDQVISLRYKDRPGLKQLAMRESEGYGFLCRIRQMPDLSLPADVSGALSNKEPRTLSEAQGLPGFVETRDEVFRSVFLSSKDKMFDVVDKKGNPVGRAICSLKSSSLVLKWIDSNSPGFGWGKASIVAVAIEASRILTPELNRHGRPVPLVVENIRNPRTTHILMKYVFKPGTVEALPCQNAFSLIGSGSPVSWNDGISEKDPRFQPLVCPSAGTEWKRYHLRGELQDSIYALAEIRFQSRRSTNNLFFLPLGIPFDPLIGLTVATVFIMAMLFKDEILNWLKGRFPPGVQDFVNSAVPDLTEFRPIIARFIARNIGIFILKTVEILGRLFGMDQLQAPVSLGIFPLHGQVTDSSSREPSSSLDNIVNAMDSSDIESLYNNLAHYFQLRGRAADVGSSSYDVPAKGLLAGGIEKVSLVDHLHHETKTIFPGIEVVPGDATNLSNHLGEESLDAVVFHRSLHHIVVDKESRGSAAGRELIEAGVFSDDIGFHVDLLSRVMGETFKTLKPGGRVLLYFDAHTFRIPGSPGFFWWSLEDMLADKGFGDVSLITSKNGTVVATGVRPNRNHGDTFVGGIEVLRRSVIDTLSDSDREVFSEALGGIAPNVFDMQGVEVLIDPRRGGSEKNSVEELNEKLGVNGGSVGEMSPEMLERFIQRDPASIHWIRGFSSKPNGVNRLAKTCAESARKGDAIASGAALAAWDDSKFLAGPNPDVVANLLAVLIGDKADRADELIDSFADAYNRARAGLLLPKLLAGRLAKSPGGSEVQPGIVLNISALFDPEAGETAKNNTWLALAAALSARERNPNVPLGLVVHGVEVNEEKVTTTLSQSVPRWANFMTDGVTLFVQGSTTNKAVFVGAKFSLTELMKYPLWARPLNVLGLTAESIVESVDYLEGVQLIPLDEFVDKQLEQVLHRLRFVLRNA